MTRHWIGLVVLSLVLLPAGLALVGGRIPIQAPPAIILVATTAAGVVAAVGCMCIAPAPIRARNVTP
ncbi:hypothetical protein [Streptomyces sp. N50]|uniref:hypothetical protein n=1 Tax=Streptomyces sp. N50 TaxID=3081765 RepID=UPI002961E9E1|nr:hypothetical protein [Streptomyces sp. N50]WOX13622.1 hypothetical protein R2B38_34475 [Streptomyces sp. N50]